MSLRASYIRAIITARIRSLLDSTGQFVPELQSVALEEIQRNGERLNVVKARFAVVVRNQDGTTTALPGRSYTLIVEMYPQLITPVTVPDFTLRSALLQCGSKPNCGNNGVVLNFYYSELQGGPNFPGSKVACHSSAYDVIDQHVLAGAYQIGGVWAPIPIPLDEILQFVTDITEIKANVIGVDFGTNQHLALTVHLDEGSPSAFDSTFTQLSQFPDSDWTLSVDTSLLSAYISSNVSARGTQLDGSVSLTAPVVAFTEGSITIDGEGSRSAGVCGTVSFTFQYTAVPKVCSRGGQSVFSLCVYNTQPPTPHFVDAAQGLCVGGGSLFSGLFTAGLATAVVSTPCQEQTYLNIHLAEDTLYATQVNLGNQFLIIGRSRLMDTTSPGRPALPLACL